MLIQVIQRISDRRYWIGPDSWTDDPLLATRVGGYVYLRDAVDDLLATGGSRNPAQAIKSYYDIVEFKIAADATGRTLDDLYRDGQAIEIWGYNQCRQGLHSWVDDPSITDPETVCTRPGCQETYGYPD
jgi:hypothetical protein